MEEVAKALSDNGLRLFAHFFPKFENTDSLDLWESTKGFVLNGSGEGKGLQRGMITTLKHSGHLVLLSGVVTR
jgi:hypothetical protein